MVCELGINRLPPTVLDIQNAGIYELSPGHVDW